MGVVTPEQGGRDGDRGELVRSVAGVYSRAQPADTYVSSSPAGPGTSGTLPRQPYDSCDESERADHELRLFFVNRFDIAFRSRDEGPRDGAHCLAAVQSLSLSGMALLRLSQWRLLPGVRRNAGAASVPVAALQGLARRANAGAASLRLEDHTRHLALCKWQRYGPCGSTKVGPA